MFRHALAAGLVLALLIVPVADAKHSNVKIRLALTPGVSISINEPGPYSVGQTVTASWTNAGFDYLWGAVLCGGDRLPYDQAWSSDWAALQSWTWSDPTPSFTLGYASDACAAYVLERTFLGSGEPLWVIHAASDTFAVTP